MTRVVAGGRRELPDGGLVGESVLKNGVQLLSESIPGVRSVSVGVWVRHGSAHETRERMGVSHLLEHMVFKGTEHRSAREIALSLEGLGGTLDAYTTREHTTFQARVLGEHLPVALDVLADLTRRPLLRADDLDLERQVVLEEISTVEDTPDDVVFELHGERFWKGHAYGHSILGTRETVAKLQQDDLREVHARRYCGRNLVVAAAGHVNHEDLERRVADLFGSLHTGGPPPRVAEPRGCEVGDDRIERGGAQSHIVFGTPSVSHADPERYAVILLSSALGGGMSSRLFQRVREELGLAYSVYSFHSFFSRGGVTGVYVGTRPAWEDRAAEAVKDELTNLSDRGLAPEELRQSKEQVKGHVMLSLERTGARLHRLASHALFGEPFLGLDALLDRIEAVSREEVEHCAARFFDPDRAFVLRVGPEIEGAPG